MKREDRRDEFDKILDSAFQAHAKTMKPELETKEDLLAQGVALHQFSPEFEAKMKRLAKKTRGNVWHGPKSKLGQHIAAAAAAAALGLELIFDHIDDMT